MFLSSFRAMYGIGPKNKGIVVHIRANIGEVINHFIFEQANVRTLYFGAFVVNIVPFV
mgnify:CR=1 FL=1